MALNATDHIYTYMREPSEPNLHRQVMTSLKLKAFYIKSFYHQEITSLPRFVGLNPERKDAIVCTAVWTTRTKSPSEKVTKSSSMLTWRMVCLCPRRMGSMAKLKVMLLRLGSFRHSLKCMFASLNLRKLNRLK